jgi:hypothetical protein
VLVEESVHESVLLSIHAVGLPSRQAWKVVCMVWRAGWVSIVYALGVGSVHAGVHGTVACQSCMLHAAGTETDIVDSYYGLQGSTLGSWSLPAGN